jgi:collagenase-like PrtC family protease
MKLLIEPANKKNINIKDSDGIIISLQDYSIQSPIYFDLDEIKKLKEENPTLEIFININKNLLNEDIEPLTNILLELDKLNIKGIFFYDLALVKMKQELNLKTDLVWHQTHMVNNYKTCNYYHSKGVKYALLGKEITLEEILEIINNSTITAMVEVVSIPSVAFSRRKLITNYFRDLNKEPKDKLIVSEKVSQKDYELTEDNNGTSFFLNEITNGTSIIKDLYENKTPYIIMREKEIPDFDELLIDTKKYIEGNCQENNYIEKYKKLGDSTNFFFKKTIYKVK